jgi:hypothetical protein
MNSIMPRKCQFFALNLFAGMLLLLAAGASAQNLFVCQYGSSNIVEVTPGGTTNIFASVPATGAASLAFDSAGNLYAGAYDGNIYKFTPNGSRSVYAPGTFALSMAFDQSGNLYTVAFGSTVTEISTNGTKSTFATGLADTFGLAFDRVGNLYVTEGPDAAIKEIATNGTQTTFASGLGDPVGLAFDGTGNLFAMCEIVNQVTEINPEGMTNNFASTQGDYLEFNAAGKLFLTEMGFGNVAEFAPDGSQSVFASGLNQPLGLAFQPVPQLLGCATNGAFQLTVTMPSPYYSTIVQVSTNLVDWSGVYTNLPPFVFTDSAAAISTNRFYRAVLQQW